MMFRYLKWRWKIWRLERRCRAAEEGTERAIERARAQNAPPHEIDAIIGGSSADVLRYKIREALSDYLISEAYRLFIPLPDWDKQDKIRESGAGYDAVKHVLTRDAINELRSAIRAEKKARAERFLMWVPGIVGILGAAIGLASILIRK
jgi:hypothetical protein